MYIFIVLEYVTSNPDSFFFFLTERVCYKLLQFGKCVFGE